jgi:hypothetical protein
MTMAKEPRLPELYLVVGRSAVSESQAFQGGAVVLHRYGSQ